MADTARKQSANLIIRSDLERRLRIAGCYHKRQGAGESFDLDKSVKWRYSSYFQTQQDKGTTGLCWC
jgi:hypothetical protein